MTTSGRVLFRCMQRLKQISECGSIAKNQSLRCASTMAQNKIIEGENGEKIFCSPFAEFNSSGMLVHEYVWRNIQNYPNQTALLCGITGKKYTYSQARDIASYIARSLNNMGLRKNDVVALIAPNYPETILAFLGMLEAELIVTTVNPYYTVDEISRQLKSSGAKGIITVAEILSVALTAAKAALPPGAPFVVIEDGTQSLPAGTVPFKDLVTRGKSLPPLKPTTLSVNDSAVLPYSSGTTGMPKGVVLSHKNLVSNMEMVERSANNEMWQKATENFQEVMPLILPFFHIFGMNGVALPRLATGAQLITLPKFTPESFVNILTNHKNTGLCCVPPIVLFLSTSQLVKRKHLECVRIAISGAAPLSKTDVEKLYDRFNIDSDALKFCQGYGLTECSPVSCLEMTGKMFSSIGKAISGCEVRLVDTSSNKDVSEPNKCGELWLRGPHVMQGYLNNETATKETLVNGEWLRTGDIAYCDDNLNFFITDRLKELIKVKAFQVAPAELEALLRTHPQVAEAAVIGIPDEKCGEVPKAFVLLKEGKNPSEEDIKNFLIGKVTKYKELKGGVTFVDNIPKNASGKILRSKLKKDYLSSC